MSHDLMLALNAALNRSITVTSGIPLALIEDLGSMILDEEIADDSFALVDSLDCPRSNIDPDDLTWDGPTGVYVRAA